MSDFEFLRITGWRFVTLGMAGALGFAFIINRMRRTPEAQRPNRQVCGWILICLGLLVTAGLTVWSFSYGQSAGIASLCLAPIGAGILVLLTGSRD